MSPNRNGVRSEVLRPSGRGRNKTRIPWAAGGVPTVPLTSPAPREIDDAFPVVVDPGEARSLRVVEAVDVVSPPLAVPQLRGRIEHRVRRGAGDVLQGCRIRMDEIREAVVRLTPWR